MDTGHGTFVTAKSRAELGKIASGMAEGSYALEKRLRLNQGVFEKGETVELKGSKFKIENLGKTHMMLKLLPWG